MRRRQVVIENLEQETENWSVCRSSISGFRFPVLHFFLFGSGSSR